MTTFTQARHLENEELLGKIEETFDNPLVRELARRFADLLDDDRYENYGHLELIAAGREEGEGCLPNALASRLADAVELLTNMGATPLTLSSEAAGWLREGGVTV